MRDSFGAFSAVNLNGILASPYWLFKSAESFCKLSELPIALIFPIATCEEDSFASFCAFIVIILPVLKKV